MSLTSSEPVPSTDALRTAVVDAAEVAGKLWLSYIFVLFYLLLTVAAIKHEDLFRETRVRPPFLQVDLPLCGFFWIGPLIVLLVHAYVLHHLALLGKRARLLDARLRAERPPGERDLLPVNLFIQMLVGPTGRRARATTRMAQIIAGATMVFGPILMLVFFELQFLPYHDETITWWHRIAVGLDLLLIVWFWPQAAARQDPTWLGRDFYPGWTWTMAVCSAVVLYVTVLVATFPREWLEAALPTFPLHETLLGSKHNGQLVASRTGFSNRLFVSGIDLVDHQKYDTIAKLATAPSPKSMQGRHLEQAVLTEANLSRVAFTDAHLQGASLVRAHAEGAWFDGADLSGAQLDEAELEGASFYKSKLVGATLGEAQLQGGRLAGANLQGAFLGKAHLDSASLAGSDLRRAIFDEAYLLGTSLNEAKLQGASLAGARLDGASFDHAEFWKTDFRRVTSGAWGVRIAKPDTDAAGCDDACNLSATAGPIRAMIEQDVPDSGNRSQMLSRLWLEFGAHRPEPWEAASTKTWGDLVPLTGKEPELAKLWAKIACVSKGAPFVIAMLVDTYEDKDGWTRPLEPGTTDEMAQQLLGKSCPATQVLTDTLRMSLMDLSRLREHPVATPAKPAPPVAHPVARIGARRIAVARNVP